MKATPNTRLLLGFALLAVMPVILGVLAFRSVDQAEIASADIARANELLLTLESLQSSIKDVEVAQHQYLLTGEHRYITEIDAVERAFERQRRELERLKAEPLWIEHLRILIPQKISEVRRMIKTREELGVQAASDLLIRLGSGETAMEDIRKAVTNMHALQLRKLRERTAVQSHSFRNTMVVFGFLLASNIALLTLMTVRVSKEQRRIRALNEDLERRVALRTEALQRSNEDLQQFAYVASHDLKEPMRMIASYSALLKRRYEGRLDDDADTYIRFITDGVRRMNLLITDLLEYSKAGEVPEEAIGPIDTSAVLQGVLTNLKVTIAESRARIRYENLPTISYDPMRLTQVFQNLIGNAIKYRGDRIPEIEITAEVSDNETIFAVKDNGIGIPPDSVNEIFGIFKRLHKSQYEGTGIGLAMVKKIIDRQGGRIWVESKPGVGSTFYFTVAQQRAVEVADAVATS